MSRVHYIIDDIEIDHKTPHSFGLTCKSCVDRGNEEITCVRIYKNHDTFGKKQ